MVDRLSCRTRALARVPALWTSSTGTHTLVSKALGVDQLSRETAGSAPSACGVDQLSRATRALVRGPPCRHGFPGASARARGPGYRAAVPCDSRLCPRAPGVNQRSRQHGPVCESPWGRPPVPGASGRYPRAHNVDQFSRASRFLVQGPALTSCPGRIVPASVFPVLNSCPGQLGLCSDGPHVHQLSRATRAWVQGTACSTSCPGRLTPVSAAPGCRPAVPGDSV